MDLVAVMAPFWSFFEHFLGVSITLGGFTFTVGAFFIWCILATILIVFVKGLAS